MAIEKFKLVETDAYLNFAVPDAGSTGNDTLIVSGTNQHRAHL